jgi:cell division control protein 6
VLAVIYKNVTGIEPPTSGMALKKLYEKVAETLAAKNRSMFVILDDADFLILRRIFHDVVNNILRLKKEYPLNIGLCTVHSISSPPLDDITSVFIPKIVKFPVYTWDETFNILNRRGKNWTVPECC